MSTSGTGQTADGSPNIVLIMADDMGFSDIGCYGGEIETPNIDGLADDGQRWTQFYNNARCCPTRASLLTGAYPHRVGIGWMTLDLDTTEEYAGDLSDDSVTIPEALGDAGYATYMTGKWHLTGDEYTDADASKHSWPLQRGFDRFYGIIGGGASYFSPGGLTRGNERIDPPEDDYYFTDAISDKAARYVRDHAESDDDDPFFLYVSYTAPHWPLHAKSEDIEKYEDRYREGWDVLREERFERQLDMGLFDEDMEPSPQDAKPWDELDEETREKMARKMAIYAAQVDAMDQGIGRIRDALEETGAFENTLFLFLSDNGACAEGDQYGWDAAMGDHDEVGDEMHPVASYGRYWANVSNTPFRLYKHWIHEGGIATPLVAHWPGVIDDGEFVRDHGHVIDVMATCLDIAGVDYPDSRGGADTVPLDGVSLLPAFEDGSYDCGPVFWEHEANRGVRTDRWKLVSKGDNGRWELYDMTSDRTELDDLHAIADQSDEHEETVDRLAGLWRDYADDVSVYPLDGRTHFERREDLPEHLEH